MKTLKRQGEQAIAFLCPSFPSAPCCYIMQWRAAAFHNIHYESGEMVNLLARAEANGFVILEKKKKKEGKLYGRLKPTHTNTHTHTHAHFEIEYPDFSMLNFDSLSAHSADAARAPKSC